MKRRIITLAVCFAVTAMIGFLFFLTLNNAVSQLPNVTQMTYNNSSEFYPITISKWEDYQSRMSTTDVSFCSELDETDIKNHTVTPVLTNENWFSVMNAPLTGSLKENTKAAVISSDLALKLYFNTDVLGKRLIIGSSEYTISGVYEKPKEIINELSSDGKERVYLYYSDYSAYKSQEIHCICYRNDAPSAPLIEQMNLSQYHSENIGEKARIINDFKSLFLLLIYITLSIIALRIWYWLCGRFFKDIRTDLSENYFFKSLRSIPLKYILLVITIGIPLLIFIAFQLIDISFFIPSKYMPYDNIFDIPYYISKIVEHRNAINSLSLSGNTYCLDLYYNSFHVLSVALAAFMIMYIVSYLAFNIIINRLLKRIGGRIHS